MSSSADTGSQTKGQDAPSRPPDELLGAPMPSLQAAAPCENNAQASVLTEWFRLKAWIAPLVAVIAAGVTGGTYIAAKVDRSELKEFERKLEEVKAVATALDKSVALATQKWEWFDHRLSSLEGQAGEATGFRKKAATASGRK